MAAVSPVVLGSAAKALMERDDTMTRERMSDRNFFIISSPLIVSVVKVLLVSHYPIGIASNSIYWQFCLSLV